MTKEEVIKEAWKEFGLTDFSNVDKNGWLPVEEEIIRNTYEEYEFEFLERYGYNSECVGWSHYRPKSLQGIETNNGWIKIESEDDLPTDTEVKYWGANQNGVFEDIIFPFESISIKYKNKTLTHYQPIQEPKPPLY